MRGGNESWRLVDGRRSGHGDGIRGGALQCLGNDARGRQADFAGDLFDSNGETEILGDIILDCEFVMQLQATNEIIGPCKILEFNAEVVDNKDKGNAVGDVVERARGISLQVP